MGTPLLKAIIVLVVICFSCYAYSQSKDFPKDIPKDILEQYNQVMNYVKNIRANEKFDPPEPPSFYIDYCYPCDEARKKKYFDDSAHFVDTYFAEEKLYLKKGSVVLHFVRQSLLLGTLSDTTYLSGDMIQAAIQISGRMQRKMTVAWNKYSPTPEKVHFLANYMIQIKRDNEIVGADVVMTDEGIVRQTEALALIHQITQAREKLNYRILLNTPVIVEAFRKAALISLTAEEMGDNVGNYLGGSQFKFTIETKAKVVGQDGATFAASLSGEGTYTAKPGKDCQLIWKQIDTPNPKLYYELKDISIRIPKPEQPVFMGTRKYTSPPAQVKLDFCDDQKDRDNVHLYGFKTESPLETWTLKGKMFPANAVLTSYIVSFPDTRQYTEFERGGVTVHSGVPFGFYFKQKPVNENPIIFEQTIDARQISPSPQNVIYGEVKLKIEYINPNQKPRTS